MASLKVRLSDQLHERIAQTAQTQGISAAQYIREAVVARIALETGRLGVLAVKLAQLAEAEDADVDEILDRLLHD